MTHNASFNCQPSAGFRRPSPKLESEEEFVFDFHISDEEVLKARTFCLKHVTVWPILYEVYKGWQG
jgi:hypothetical protein